MEDMGTGGDRGHPHVHEYDAPSEEHRQGGEGAKEQAKEQKSAAGREHVRSFDSKSGDAKSADTKPAAPQPQEEAVRRLGDARQELSGFADQASNATSIAYGAMSHAILEWQKRFAVFVGRRMDKNIDFARNFARASDLGTMMRMQSEYLRDAFADYASAMETIPSRSMDEARQMGREAMSDAERAAALLRASGERLVERR